MKCLYLASFLGLIAILLSMVAASLVSHSDDLYLPRYIFIRRGWPTVIGLSFNLMLSWSVPHWWAYGSIGLAWGLSFPVRQRVADYLMRLPGPPFRLWLGWEHLLNIVVHWWLWPLTVPYGLLIRGWFARSA